MRLVGFLVSVLFAGNVLAAGTYRWSESEVNAMPPYCQARFGDKSASAYEHWRQAIGEDFIHTHHYCHGLGFLNRYYGTSRPQDKKRILQSAYGSFIYVIPRVSPTYPMLPEAYLNLGTVLALMGKDGEALQAMRKAAELDPNMARAYTATANQYAQLKMKDEALKVATEGLRHVPDSSALQRLYVKLGGQLPYPEPVAQQVQAPAAPAEASPAAPVAAGAEVTQSAGPNETKAAGDGGGGAVVAPPKIGSPSNPWCRFCPPEPGQ
jgi:tetratricopeptide (TPR) repeat protein